jgi:hypothetical protein
MKDDGRPRDWVEIVATFLLSVAAIATAWSSYQATRWNGEQAKASSRTNAIRIQASRAQGLAEADTQVDIATFIQWVNARARQEPGLATFYRERFRDEFVPAFKAWIATKPIENRNAPPSPFRMPEYRLAARVDAERLDAAAELSSAQVRRNIQRGSNYVLCVVLFAVSLFFAGISTRTTAPGSRKVLLGIGCLLFVGTVAWLATFPVSVDI